MDDFNQEQLDVLGTSAINTTFTLLGYCRPYVNTADKKPIWDGELFVYKTSKDFSKNNLDFVLPLQVKTTYYNKRNFPKQAKHKVYISELKAYLEDRGVLFLNVLVNNEGGNQIYCGYLTKSEIKKYIAKAKKHDSITIYFQRLPRSFKPFYDELYTLHLQRQLNSISVDELKNLKNAKYKFSVRHIPADSDIIMHIANNPVDVLVECDGFSDPFYLGDCRAYLQFSEFIETPISVDGVIYFNGFSKTPQKDGYLIKIGASTSFNILPDANIKGKYNFNVSVTVPQEGTIKDILHELKFVISSFEKGGFSIGKSWHSYPPLTQNNSDALEVWKKSLNFWQDVSTLFETLGIEEELAIKNLDDKTLRDLQTLVDAFVYDKRVIGAEHDSQTVTFSIGNINILVFAEHIEGRYFKLRDIFSHLLVSTGSNDKKVIISPYMIPYMSILEKTPDNIPINRIRTSYDGLLRLNPNIQDFAIENLLAMLIAFDRTNRKIHLRAASILAQWLIDNNSDKKLINIHKLNLFQTILRERSFNEDELEELADIAVEAKDKSLRVAANALLGNSILVKRIWLNLNKNAQKDLSSRPIYKFIQPYI